MSNHARDSPLLYVGANIYFTTNDYNHMTTINAIDERAEFKELLEHLTTSAEEVLNVWVEITSLSDDPLSEIDMWRIRKNIHGMVTDSYNLMGIVLEVEDKLRKAKYV